MFNELKLETKHNACFVAGTLVHTDKGLVPIEQIKVGDMVLSRHESGEGEATYKHVTNTFITKNQPIWAIHAVGINDEDLIFATGNHPFWVYDLINDKPDTTTGTWYSVDSIETFSPIALLKNEIGLWYSSLPLVSTHDKTKAFYPVFAKYGFPTGYFLDIDDYKNHNLVPPDSGYKAASQCDVTNLDKFGNNISTSFLADVYNIEVEDYHTYYVGKSGFWVHNDNCLEENIPWESMPITTKDEILAGTKPVTKGKELYHSTYVSADAQKILNLNPSHYADH